MVLLYCAVVYFSGLIAGRIAWQMGMIGCDFPGWIWLFPAALLPMTPLFNRLAKPSSMPMRWPASAGFAPIRSGPSPALLIAALLCLVTGYARYASHPLTPCWTADDLAYYNLPPDRAFDREAPQVVVTGMVSSYPTVADTKQRIHVTVESIQVDGSKQGDVWQPVEGVLRLSTGIRQRYAYGQPVRLRGRLVTPPDFEDFSYREYLARKGIHSLMYSARIDVLDGPNLGNPILQRIYALRANGEALLNRLLPEPYAALANGMLLGIEAGIPDDLYDKFNLTGTSHVIVISGSNVALIAGVLVAFGTRIFGRKRAVYPALLGIACYALLVGGDAAVMRAALMGGLFVYATAIGRRSTALVSLAAACWAMTLVNPLTFWDVGFQLSSAATAGLILFSPTITSAFDTLVTKVRSLHSTPPSPNHEFPFPTPQSPITSTLRSLIEDGLLITIAANITTLPLVVYYFGRLSLVSLLTNLLIAPVQPFIMLWGSAAVLVGVSGLPWLAQVILWVPWLSLVWTVAMVEWTASLPGASLEIVQYGLGALIMTYVLTFGIHWRHSLSNGWQRLRAWGAVDLSSRLLAPALAGILAVLAVVVWRFALTQPDGRLHVDFLNIGQGDGILITTPSGRQVLVDGGKSPQALFNELGESMPFWDRSIDVLLLTHPDGDHMIGQIGVPQRFQVSHALDTAISQANPDAQGWRDSLAAAGASVHVQHSGGWVDLGDGVALWILWPPPGGFEHEHADNENSLVAKLIYGDFSVLFTGDAGLPSEAAWVRANVPLASTVLKVGHHGSNSATSPELLEAVNPSVAVIQVGADNDYGHPTEEVLATMEGRLILRSDRDGRVHIVSDGRQMWIATEEGDFPE